MDFPLHLPYTLDVSGFQECVDRVRQAAYQQVFAEQVHHLVVHSLIQCLARLEFCAQGRDGSLIQTVGQQKFLQVQRVHAHLADTAHRNGGRLRQRAPQQRTAGNVGETPILRQKFQQRQELRILLNFIEKDQCILLFFHFVAVQHAELKVEILHRAGLREQTFAQRVLHHVDLDKIFKQLLAHIADDIGLANLARPIHQQDARVLRAQVVGDQTGNFSVQHGTHLANYFSIELYSNFNDISI